MTTIILLAALGIMLLTVPYLWRVVVGPTVFDRVQALNAIGTKVPVLLVLVGVLHRRVDMFVDIALALMLLNLFATLLISRYVRERRRLQE
jgi:multicomponent Na+:H+ antiporter subunit F